MESLIITTEPLKNRSMKCLNVSKQLNNKPNTLIGKSTELLREKNSITMPLLESPIGNFPIKSRSINSNSINKSAKKNNLMAHQKHNKNFHRKRKSKRKLFHSSKPNLSMSTLSGNHASKCVKMMKDGPSWKLVKKKDSSTIILLILKSWLRCRKKQRQKLIKLNFWKCSDKPNF